MKKLRIVSYFLMALGVMLFFIGIISKIQHWPDMTRGIYSGPVLLIIGSIMFIAGLKRK